MPFIPVPSVGANYGNPGQPPAPHAGQIVTGQWPVVVAYPPQPVEIWDLGSFYIPVSVLASQAVAGSPPSVCNLTVRLLRSGMVCFQDTIQITSLVTLGNNPGWVGGNGAANVTINTPVAFYSGQTLTAGFDASFDKDTAAALIVLGAQIQDPNTAAMTTIPGSIGYTTESAVPEAA